MLSMKLVLVLQILLPQDINRIGTKYDPLVIYLMNK
jgi:hypothetical protein